MNLFFSSGDLDFFWEEQLKALSWLPTVWHADTGFGWSGIASLWLNYPYQLFVKFLNTLGLSWWGIEKILWLGMFTLAMWASFRLASYVCTSKRMACITALLYSSNTYILLLFSGGQLGVALAYSLSPYVLYRFITYIDSVSLNREVFSIKYLVSSIKNGLILALLICFDLRLAYLIVGAICLYMLLRVAGCGLRVKQIVIMVFYVFILPLIVTVFLHSFWILPMIMVGGGMSGLGEDFTNAGMLKFLSFADFSHTLSFLHPNWPENLFGKVYFLQPEFLVLPMVAFSSLLFVKTLRVSSDGLKAKNSQLVTRNYITFFSLLALLGAFFAKGANEPFGGIYVWCFQHIPGFMMFRDPTKFYLYIALGYSILIPFTLFQVSHWIYDKRFMMKDTMRKTQLFIVYCLVSIFVVFWCFTIRAVFLGHVSGNFKPLEIPDEFITLKTLLVQDTEPSRTLWIPTRDTFAYYSTIHPLLSGSTLFANASISAVTAYIYEPAFKKTIDKAGVRYIIVPLDMEKRIFLSDYQWDPVMRTTLIDALTASGLKRNTNFTHLAVFENPIFTFVSEKPSYVEKQEYWSRIGLGLSVILSILFFGLIFFGRKRISTQ